MIMADPTLALDPSVRAALVKLVDIAVPPPVSLLPQTWGWAALAALILALLACAAVGWHRHREANRYRAEALAELSRITQTLRDGAASAEALAALPPLLKRVALAAWPRSRVAALAQARWVEFVHATESHAVLAAPLTKLLDDIEYRPAADLDGISADDAQACVQAAKQWVEAHRVSA
jgi:hypothetical protein